MNHGDNTNAHEGRKPVGNVVGSFIKNIKNKLSNVVIGYFQNPEAVEKMDINSMEADVDVNAENSVKDIKLLSGIALGSSNENSPAFPGAVRLATLQCFEIQSEEEKPKDGGNKMPTLIEVKQWVKDLNIQPNQLFEMGELKNDRVFGKIVDANESLTEEVKTLNTAIKETKESSQKTLRDSQINLSKTRLTELLPEGLTENQKKFAVTRFNPEKIDDLSDEGLKGYIESSKKEFAEVAKIMNVEQESSTDNNDTIIKIDGDVDVESEALEYMKEE